MPDEQTTLLDVTEDNGGAPFEVDEGSTGEGDDGDEIAELTTADRAELGRYEAVIGRGFGVFVEVGNALIAIREGKLYRGSYGTFEDYCQQRWGMVSSRARQLMSAAETIESLKSDTNVTLLPTNEAQARPLAKLEPPQRVEAWGKAVQDANGKQPTAAQVQKATVEFAKPTPPKERIEQPARASQEQLQDKLNEWLAIQVREADSPPDIILDVLVGHESSDGTGIRGRLIDWLASERVTYRFSDLMRAIEMVRQERQMAAEQAKSRVRYLEQPRVESTPADPDPILPPDLAAAGYIFNVVGNGMWALLNDDEPEPYQSNWHYDPADCIPEAREHLARLTDEAAAVAIVEAERVAEDAQRAERDAGRVSYERAPEPVVMPEQAPALLAPDTTALPDDLVEAGFRLFQPKPNAWAIERDEEHGGDYESNWHIKANIDLAIEEAREYLATRGDEAAKLGATRVIGSKVTHICSEFLAILEEAAPLIGDRALVANLTNNVAALLEKFTPTSNQE